MCRRSRRWRDAAQWRRAQTDIVANLAQPLPIRPAHVAQQMTDAVRRHNQRLSDHLSGQVQGVIGAPPASRRAMADADHWHLSGDRCHRHASPRIGTPGPGVSFALDDPPRLRGRCSLKDWRRGLLNARQGLRRKSVRGRHHRYSPDSAISISMSGSAISTLPWSRVMMPLSAHTDNWRLICSRLIPAKWARSVWLS
jgi:hypothetical protein